MSGSDPTPDAAAGPEDRERLRRLREQVFGEVLPDTTADERDPERRGSGETGNDEWLRSNVPPHHG